MSEEKGYNCAYCMEFIPEGETAHTMDDGDVCCSLECLANIYLTNNDNYREFTVGEEEEN